MFSRFDIKKIQFNPKCSMRPTFPTRPKSFWSDQKSNSTRRTRIRQKSSPILLRYIWPDRRGQFPRPFLKPGGSYQFPKKIQFPTFFFDWSVGGSVCTGPVIWLFRYLSKWKWKPLSQLGDNCQAKVKYLSFSILLYYIMTHTSD